MRGDTEWTDNPTVQIIVGIGAADRRVVDQIETVVLQKALPLKTACFTPRKSLVLALQARQSELPPQTKVWVPLLVICLEPAVAVHTDGHGATDFLAMAQHFVRTGIFNVVAISSKSVLQAEMLVQGCVAALSLEELLRQIPDNLSGWLQPRAQEFRCAALSDELLRRHLLEKMFADWADDSIRDKVRSVICAGEGPPLGLSPQTKAKIDEHTPACELCGSRVHDLKEGLFARIEEALLQIGPS